MKIKKGFIVREVGGENIAVPVGDMAKQFRGMIKLNETALYLWNFFAEEKTREEAVEALMNEYAVDAAEAETGVESFVSVALENGFME